MPEPQNAQYTLFGVAGSITTSVAAITVALIAGSPPASSVQLAPPSVVFHTPPRAVARYIVLGEVGWTAIDATRPDTMMRATPPRLCPFGIAIGPICTQLAAPGTESPVPASPVAAGSVRRPPRKRFIFFACSSALRRRCAIGG